jgi:5-methylcytosine-specific restriction protein A
MTERIRGRKLQEIRALHFKANPLCVECYKLDRVRLATQLDHIKALTNGGTDTADNRQGLCAQCHAAKTARDMGYRKRTTIGDDGWPK